MVLSPVETKNLESEKDLLCLVIEARGTIAGESAGKN